MTDDGLHKDGSSNSENRSLEDLRAGRKRHADKELLQNDVSSGSDDENLKENGGVNSTSSTVNFVLSDSSSSGRLRSFSLAAPKLQASASFTIESRASRSASIAESGFGMSAAKRFAFSVSQPKNAEAEGESCAPSKSSEVATTISSESTSNSVSGSSRGLTPSRTVIQHVPGMAMQSESSSFVFGCDMSDRVTNTPTQAANEQVTSDEVRKEDGSLNNHSPVNESGSPGGLFAQASSRLCDGAVVASVTPPPVFKVPEIVDVKTGEENDKNILQVHCVLHVFDSKTHGWSERGRGLLRLNDMHHPNEDGTFQSRLVMRTDGSLRLTLNTLLWPQMVCEKASRRSIRITALDAAGQGIRVFLITCAAKDVHPLHNAVNTRLSALKLRHAVLTSQAAAVDPDDDSDRGDKPNYDETSGTSDLSEADSDVVRKETLNRERLEKVASVSDHEND